jgi:hypothetical protein
MRQSSCRPFSRCAAADPSFSHSSLWLVFAGD